MVHIISRSMGNRVTSEALLQPSYTFTKSTRLGQLIFAAADEDAEVFAQYLAQLSAFQVGVSSSQAFSIGTYPSARPGMAQPHNLHAKSHILKENVWADTGNL